MSNSNPAPGASPISTPPPRTSAQRSGGKTVATGRPGRPWLLLTSGTLMLLVLLGIVFFFGRVQGREFAPSHFEIRRFSFTEIPLLQLQITPIRRVKETSGLQTYLATSSLVRSPTGQPARWHLIELRRLSGSSGPADAKLLTDFLGADQAGFFAQGNPYWHRWSTENPGHAAILWPLVQKLAERELYVLVPHVFQIADAAATVPKSNGQSPDAMEARLHQFLISSYAGLVNDMRAAGKADVAESLRQEALADYPDQTQFLNGL